MARESPKMVADYPALAREWATDLNGDLTPETAKATWARKVYWRSATDPSHCWLASISARVRGDSPCPFCWQAPESQIARDIATKLRKTFQSDPNQHKIALPDCEGAFDVDFLIPSPFGGRSLVVEYDSYFQHKCVREGCRHGGSCRHSRDRGKTTRLQRMGYVVVRIRELPLDPTCRDKKHHRRDLYVPHGATAGTIVALLAPHIASVYGRERRASEPES